ncbi:soil-associated protein, TIGR03435 family [Mucilaginibacter pineti]|uniref:Soil-associated protein, TIGR03435 family n=2 Tax=Mucilaginibacter pineti TaxID=1391627 RepID=A0A1G7LBC8_9SPHI|nr:soil-associated protein, TIGR03435 family [Mucilaginibacter pineti]
MKKIALSLLLLISCAYAQVKNHEVVPDINFTTVLNAPVKATTLSQLKGKIILIEFWATWCGACLEAMPHLKQLQQKYPDRLQVITVTEETAKRTGQYLASRPSNLWFAVDTGGSIAKIFPHQLITHSVLISSEGKLIANTNPESITDLLIDSIVNKKEIHVSEKKDFQISSEDELINTVFPATETLKKRFDMQPEIKGARGLSTAYLTDSTWHGKRITAINCNIVALYRVAYGNFPYRRVIDSSHTQENSPRYCLDIIVENKTELLPTMQNELLKRFDVQARIENQLKDVYVLKVTDPVKFKGIPVNRSGIRTYMGRHGEIDQQGLTMTDFANYLENNGTGRLLVVDETHVDKKFDIKFSFQPENPQSLTDILTAMGLRLNKEKRKVQMLTLHKE